MTTVNSWNSRASSAEQYRQTKRKGLRALICLVVCLVMSLIVDVLSGPGNFSFSDVFDSLVSGGSSNASLNIVIWDIRLPIAVLAILVGAMLGLSGALIQTILNNPLAEPFTLGISSAASFGAALAIVFGARYVSWDGSLLITLSAFFFAIFTSLLLYFFTRLRGASSQTLVLVGIALLFTFNALLSLLQFAATDTQLTQIVFWMMGSLNRASWVNVGICSLVFALIFPLFLHKSWSLTALRMGDDKAEALGVNVKVLRIEVLVGASLLAATTVSFVGIVGFVGLVGPHIARMLVGEDQRFFLPMAAVCGALIMSLTSYISKSVSPGVVYPIGIITALVGVPFFVSLILTVQRRNWR